MPCHQHAGTNTSFRTLPSRCAYLRLLHLHKTDWDEVPEPEQRDFKESRPHDGADRQGGGHRLSGLQHDRLTRSAITHDAHRHHEHMIVVSQGARTIAGRAKQAQHIKACAACMGHRRDVASGQWGAADHHYPAATSTRPQRVAGHNTKRQTRHHTNACAAVAHTTVGAIAAQRG